MNPHDPRQKLLTHSRAIEFTRSAQARGESVVLTNGCFDLLHVGHIHTLEEARKCGDQLVEALKSDSSIRALKGPSRPEVPLSHRMTMVASLACVDRVVSFRNETPLSLIRNLKPDVLAKGGDWKRETMVGASEVESWGGKVVSLGEIKGVRTSEIIQKIRG